MTKFCLHPLSSNLQGKQAPITASKLVRTKLRKNLLLTFKAGVPVFRKLDNTILISGAIMVVSMTLLSCLPGNAKRKNRGLSIAPPRNNRSRRQSGGKRTEIK